VLHTQTPKIGQCCQITWIYAGKAAWACRLNVNDINALVPR
jgi:hypothetical protein